MKIESNVYKTIVFGESFFSSSTSLDNGLSVIFAFECAFFQLSQKRFKSLLSNDFYRCVLVFRKHFSNGIIPWCLYTLMHTF